ncbi:MAG: YjcZ family sporulation protein [Bacillaceae bacterium]|nr:YjcZ family sporulation protein [Bacillaceae bacterium]
MTVPGGPCATTVAAAPAPLAGFAFVVVLFILLVIIGAAYVGHGY